MYLNATLTFPLVDADRRGDNHDGNGGKIGARTIIVLAYLLLCALWLVARVNGYWR